MGQIKNIKLHIVTDIKSRPYLPRNNNNKDGGRRCRCTDGIEEEKNIPKVHVPWCRFGSTPRPLQRTTHGNSARPGTPPLHARTENETTRVDEETEESEERSSGEREAGCREDTSPKHDRVTRHDRFHHRHPQRENFQSSRDQTRDDRTLSWRVFVDLQ